MVVVVFPAFSCRAAFGEVTEDGKTIKRLADADDSDSDSDAPLAKVVRTAKPTDLLAAPSATAAAASFTRNKKLNLLVKPKTTVASSAPTVSATVPAAAPTKLTAGLSLLGAYSDSDSDH